MSQTEVSEIRADVCYALPDFKRKTGQGQAALRNARKKGLLIRKVGLRAYILGKDWLQFVEEHGKPVA